jgi:hypothetical protein
MVKTSGAGPGGALRRTPRPVHPVQCRQHAGNRALHAERNAGDPLLPKPGQAGLIDAFGVGLGGYLGPGPQTELAVDGPQDATKRGGRQQGRRPAAEEHRADAGVDVAEDLAGEADLGDRQRGIGGERRGRAAAELGRGVGVEVAVSAAGCAERDVHVDPEGPRSEAGPRAFRQGSLGGDGLTIRQGARHGSHATRRNASGCPDGWCSRRVSPDRRFPGSAGHCPAGPSSSVRRWSPWPAARISGRR